MSPEDAYKRLARIFPMMSSDSEGEVCNAARAMTKVLKESGLHWNDVAKRIVDGAPPFEEVKPGNKPGFNRNRDAEDTFRARRPKEPPPEGPRRKPSAWKLDEEDVKKIMASGKLDALDDWSTEFLENIEDWVIHNGRSLTSKQRDKVNELLDKLGL